jgi:integration host factor subunit beta
MFRAVENSTALFSWRSRRPDSPFPGNPTKPSIFLEKILYVPHRLDYGYSFLETGSDTEVHTRMNKLELIKALGEETGLSQPEAAYIVRYFFDAMSEALCNGDRVEIRGLWSFHVKNYPSYQGRNPKSGKVVTVQEKSLPYFKCGKELRDRVNGIDRRADFSPEHGPENA